MKSPGHATRRDYDSRVTTAPPARTLVVTNDFPPRLGGIETFCHELTRRLDPDRLVVLTAAMPGSAAVDAAAPFPIHRLPTGTLLPTRGVRLAAARLIERYRCDSVWFGAAATLGLLAPALRACPGVRRIVASTHGHERTWAKVPVGRSILRRIASGVDVLTYISDAVLETLVPALPNPPPRLVRLTPGVDLARFAVPPSETLDDDGATGSVGPAAGAAPGRGYAPGGIPAEVSSRPGPIVACVSRLVKLKGQDVLLRAWPAVVRAHPDATLWLVGAGPRRRRLEAQARQAGVADSVLFTGGLPFAAIPQVYARADIAVLLTRPVAAGLVAEGLGAVTLEASASGLPVIVGRTGGAVETVRDGETGYLVDPQDHRAVAAHIINLLDDPAHAQALGTAGRAWMESDWSWDQRAATLAGLLGHN
jgi:phosphatidylinositol alpha-1,6-mannosyltransferase